MTYKQMDVQCSNKALFIQVGCWLDLTWESQFVDPCFNMYSVGTHSNLNLGLPRMEDSEVRVDTRQD